MCSVPIQVKGGKEPKESHEVDSKENGKRVKVDRSDENVKKLPPKIIQLFFFKI